MANNRIISYRISDFSPKKTMNNKWRAFRHANDGKNDGKQLASIPFSMKQNWRAFRHANDGKNDGKQLASIPCSMNKNRGAFRHAKDCKNDGQNWRAFCPSSGGKNAC